MGQSESLQTSVCLKNLLQSNKSWNISHLSGGLHRSGCTCCKLSMLSHCLDLSIWPRPQVDEQADQLDQRVGR